METKTLRVSEGVLDTLLAAGIDPRDVLADAAKSVRETGVFDMGNPAEEAEEQKLVVLRVPQELKELADRIDATPGFILKSFILDLCGLEGTNGSDERGHADDWFDRVLWPSDLDDGDSDGNIVEAAEFDMGDFDPETQLLADDVCKILCVEPATWKMLDWEGNCIDEAGDMYALFHRQDAELDDFVVAPKMIERSKIKKFLKNTRAGY